MHRNVTAIYRTREVAELVRRGLQDVGIPADDIHIIPDPAHDSAAGRAAAAGDRTTTRTTTGTGAGAAPRGMAAAARDEGGVSGTGAVPEHTSGHHPLQGAGALGRGGDDLRDTDRLHDLNLPEEDLRTYQHCVRRGDYIVSAEVDQDRLEKVQAIMRRPEAEVRDIEHHSSEFRNESLIGHSLGEGHMLDQDRRARRLSSGDDRYARTYERDQRLGILRGL